MVRFNYSRDGTPLFWYQVCVLFALPEIIYERKDSFRFVVSEDFVLAQEAELES